MPEEKYIVSMPENWIPGKCSERAIDGWIITCPIPCFDRSFNQRFYPGECPLASAKPAVPYQWSSGIGPGDNELFAVRKEKEGV